MIRLLFLFSIFIVSSCTYNEIVPVCNPDEQLFVELVQPIIESNCIACHNADSGRPAVLSTYEGVMDALDNYALKSRVVSLDMPPSVSPELSDSEIAIIKKWADCE
jgi:uncharacterized membrane protein